MATTALDLDFSPRRAHARLRLGIPAQLMTVNGPREIILIDLSQSGARVQLSGQERITDGVLSWMGFEVFGVRVWQTGQTIGLQFERPISSGWVLATRNWRPSKREARIESRSFARDWVKGANDQSIEPLRNGRVSRPSPSLDLQKLRQSNKGHWSQSNMVYILGAGLVGIIAGIWSCYF